MLSHSSAEERATKATTGFVSLIEDFVRHIGFYVKKLSRVLVRFNHVSRIFVGRQRMKYWEIIADNLSKRGWTWLKATSGREK